MNRTLALLLALAAAVTHAAAQQAAAAPRPGTILVETYVDGVCELHVTKSGLFWVNGMYAKPGLHGKTNEPTYINGQPWSPAWTKPQERYGVDQCLPYPINIATLAMNLELIAVGTQRGGEGIEPRSPITLSGDAEELIVIIPDPEYGPRWYKFALVPKK